MEESRSGGLSCWQAQKSRMRNKNRASCVNYPCLSDSPACSAILNPHLDFFLTSQEILGRALHAHSLHSSTLSESLSQRVTSILSACSHGGHWMPHARCLRCTGQLSSSSSSAWATARATASTLFASSKEGGSAMTCAQHHLAALAVASSFLASCQLASYANYSPVTAFACHRPARRDQESQRGPGSVMQSLIQEQLFCCVDATSPRSR